MEFIVNCPTLTEDDVYKFFYNWIISERMGECIPKEESVALSADEIARSNTEYFVRFIENLKN